MTDASVVEGTLRKRNEIAGSTITHNLFLLQLKSKNFLTYPSHINLKVSSLWTEIDRFTAKDLFADSCEQGNDPLREFLDHLNVYCHAVKKEFSERS